ncbi:hypothetical protein DIPPA_30451 [Diplonema papillatum]|nr:hypothetical protein DIPPA_30451 [Diplonema papillatum]
MATSAPSLGGLANERLNASVMSLGRLSMPAPARFEPSISALFDGTTDPRLAHSNYTGAARPPAAMSTTLPPGPANPFLAGTLAHVPKTGNALFTAGGSATIHHGYIPGQQVEAAHNLCIRE